MDEQSSGVGVSDISQNTITRRRLSNKTIRSKHRSVHVIDNEDDLTQQSERKNKMDEDTVIYDNATCLLIPDTQPHDAKPSAVHESKSTRILEELMTTEVKYIKKIKLLQKIQQGAWDILRTPEAKSLFPYIDSICQLHSDFLLILQDRLKTWKRHCMVGDHLKQFASHLTLYKDYVTYHQKSLSLVRKWEKNSKEIADLIENSISDMNKVDSSKLNIAAYMLEPIQRIPRYELLLNQYLKHIPRTNAEECQDIEDALKSIREAATSVDSAIQQRDELDKLFTMQKHIDTPILSITRSLRKTELLDKVSVKGKSFAPRHLLLFNDLLLICRRSTSRGSTKYNVADQLALQDMKILAEENDDKTRFVLIIKTASSVVTIDFAKDKQKWLNWKEAFKSVLEAEKEDPNRKQYQECFMKIEERKSKLLGKFEPGWIDDSDTSMCMKCGQNFTVTIRKHHCRACGKVICGKCSTRRLKLEYDESQKQLRVCDECHIILTNDHRTIRLQRHMSRDWHMNKCIHGGEIEVSRDNGKSWIAFWVEISDSYVLTLYRARLDSLAQSTLNLLNYTIAIETSLKRFKLSSEEDDKVLFVKVPDEDAFSQWEHGFLKAKSSE